ncbi:hypothetical protein BDQ17DRAFT_1411905 [Cyathus striatus]|nr:hypothetical protein BDQ17DRAFT_1411905 [Cyathus striatus]
MSTALRSLSRTATSCFSRPYLAASPRTVYSRFRIPQRLSNAPLSTSQPFQTQQYGYSPPKPPLWSRMMYKPDGTPRSKLKGFGIACITVVSLIMWFAALRAVAESELENTLLTCLVHVQHAIFQLPFVDVNDPMVLLDIVKSLCIAFKDDEDLATDIDEVFGEIEEYVRKHASEMQDFKLRFNDLDKLQHQVTSSNIGSFSDPVKVKFLLAAYCYSTLQCVKNVDGTPPHEMLLNIGTTLQGVLAALVELSASDKRPATVNAEEGPGGEEDFQIIG